MKVESFVDGAMGRIPWINATGLPVDDVSPFYNEIAAALSTWVEDQKLRGDAASPGGMFERNAYVAPEHIFDQMRLARRAVESDDIVGGVADTTEAIALNEVHWESDSVDEADVFNQIAGRVNLDAFGRQAWRELYSCSQYVAAAWWGQATYKVRGRTEPTFEEPKPDPNAGPLNPDAKLPARVKRGNRRKKTYSVYAPTALTMLDSTRVVPLGNLMFGRETLTWHASAEEMEAFARLESGTLYDPLMATLFVGRYVCSKEEREFCAKLGVNVNRLLTLNPANVWRHTLTRPHYQRWPDLRLKGVFRWLDMKQQLMAADRVALVGNANYILLIKKGTDDKPADPKEVDALKDNYHHMARLPVVISDHRLTIEIITPSSDFTLLEERYRVVDSHIFDRCIGSFAGGPESPDVLLAQTVGKGMENRRRMMRRDFEAVLARQVVNHPANTGVFEDEPNLVFSPRTIEFGDDAARTQAMMALRAAGDLSRWTSLEELGFDQEVEAQRRLVEQEQYDAIFRTVVPFSSPGASPYAAGGGGALPPGGGGGGRPPAKPAKKTPAPRRDTGRKKATS